MIEYNHTSFTLVSTVFNEFSRLDDTLADFDAQTLQPNEIIVTDAGSTDGTYEKLVEWGKQKSFPVKILQEKGCNVARGRNLAIKEASNDIIVSTDFGCRFNKDWLKSVIEPFEDKSIDVVGGAFSVQEEKINTLAAKSDYILQKGYPVIMDEYFSVSSRSIAYKKKVWEKVGGYPEWLTLAADDTIFWKLVKKDEFKYLFVKNPNVYWNRHQTNKAFAKEAFRYGLGDGESRINYHNFWSNLFETGLRYCLFLSIIIIFLFLPFFQLITYHLSLITYHLSPLLPLLFLPGLRSYYYAFINWRSLKSKKYNLKVFMNALWQLELSRFQYIKGYIQGLRNKDKQKQEGRQNLWKVLDT